jgi:phosphotriesterase-related protein
MTATTTVTEVETVRGPVPTAELGTTLMHEHVFVLTPDSQANWSDEWDEETKVAEAIDKLTQLTKVGVRTIADPTVDGLGRDIRRVARINEAVPDLNIVAATGVYTYADVPGFFAERGPGALPDLPEPMIDLFVRDIREGIQGTGIKAAFFKCAIDNHGLTPGVERVMRAVARAHAQTGAPIMVHNRPAGNTMDEVRRVLGEEGVDPRRVQLAHVGDSVDVDLLAGLAAEGFLLGMDRFGIDPILGFEDRVATVVALCRRGLSSRMVLAHDAVCYIDWLQPDLLPFLPNWNYLHIHNDVVPALLERGVTQDQLDDMLIHNPRTWFERT